MTTSRSHPGTIESNSPPIRILADDRWTRPSDRTILGIRRFASEILARIPGWEPVSSRVPLLHPFEPAWLALDARRRRPDVYFTPGSNPPLTAHVPLVLTIHDLIHLHFADETSAVKRAYYRAVVRPATRRARAVLTVSEYSKQEIVAWAGIEPGRVIVVGGGVSNDFGPKGARHAPGYPYVLHVGSWKPHKNVERLIEAFGRAGLDDHRLVLTGDPDQRLEAIAARAGARGRLVFVGLLGDDALPALYRGAAAVAVPSLYEGFGLPALEGMSCGVPVVAADATSLPEVVGDAGILVDPRDADSIANGLRHAVLDGTLGHRGLERARLWSWDEAAARARRILAPPPD